ncbi:MAG: VWA domain-containing protein, partial [Actinomycetales bacterium]|nr:VWA domain-containing protein [Actinomycetales bacterium]
MRGGSPRGLARIGAGVAAMAVVVLSASPAFATTGRIESLPTLPDGDLGIVFSAVGLAPGETIDLSTVKVAINGQPAVSRASFVADTATQPLRQTMLTIDVSGSMANVIGTSRTTRIDAAKQAANAFLSGVPKDVYVGIVTFADAAKVARAPTQDHAKVKQVIDGLAATNGNTALFDAVVAANGALDPKGIGNQLLLTDGANDRGTNTLATAAANVKASKVVLDAVSIGADAVGLKQLTTLTTAGNGSTVSADNASQLTDIFTSAATDQANQVIIDVTVPPNLAGT